MKLLYLIKNTVTLIASYLVFSGINTVHSVTWLKLVSLWDIIGNGIGLAMLVLAAVIIFAADTTQKLEFSKKISEEFSYFWAFFSPFTYLISLITLIYVGAFWFAFAELVSFIIMIGIVSFNYKQKKAYNELLKKALEEAAANKARWDKDKATMERIFGYKVGSTVDV